MKDDSSIIPLRQPGSVEDPLTEIAYGRNRGGGAAPARIKEAEKRRRGYFPA